MDRKWETGCGESWLGKSYSRLAIIRKTWGIGDSYV